MTSSARLHPDHQVYNRFLLDPSASLPMWLDLMPSGDRATNGGSIAGYIAAGNSAAVMQHLESLIPAAVDPKPAIMHGQQGAVAADGTIIVENLPVVQCLLDAHENRDGLLPFVTGFSRAERRIFLERIVRLVQVELGGRLVRNTMIAELYDIQHQGPDRHRFLLKDFYLEHPFAIFDTAPLFEESNDTIANTQERFQAVSQCRYRLSLMSSVHPPQHEGAGSSGARRRLEAAQGESYGVQRPHRQVVSCMK